MSDFFSRYNQQVKDDLAIIDIAITNTYKEMNKAKQHALENGIDVKPFDRLLSVSHAIDRTHAHIYTLYVLSKHLYDWTLKKHRAINAGGV